jgi:hypothetical protein
MSEASPASNSEYQDLPRYQRGLDSLMRMRASGALTDAQYEVQKNALFDRYNYPSGKRPARVVKKSRAPGCFLTIAVLFLLMVLLVGQASSTRCRVRPFSR